MTLRVVCVDDEQSANINLQYDLKKYHEIGEIATFTNARKALEYVADHVVDVAFLDIRMPMMSGIELAKKIKEISPKVKVVFLSGEAKHMEEIEGIGAVAYLLKPYMDSELDEVVELLKSER